MLIFQKVPHKNVIHFAFSLIFSIFPIYYYSKENSQLELDFVIQAGMQVIPVEVKTEENLQSKSLKATIAKYPGMKGLRFSMSDYREQDGITNVPLYGARGYCLSFLYTPTSHRGI